MAGEALQQKTIHKGRKNSKLHDLQRHKGGGVCIWNIQGTTAHKGVKTKGCQGHRFYMCGLAQHAEDTSGQSRQGLNPSKGCSVTTK